MEHDAFFDDGPPISQLQAAVKSLEEYVQHLVPPAETPVANDPVTTSSSTASTSPNVAKRRSVLTPIQVFSRQEFASAKWKDLAKSHIAICGLGAIGALTAEALVRAGVGKLYLIDQVDIDMSAMGSMVYQPQEIGFSRTQALRLRLQAISSQHTTIVDSFAANFSHDMDLAELKKKLRVSSVGTTPSSDADASFGLFEALTLKRPYDLVLCCLDNEDAALQINQICLELSLPMLRVGLSPCNMKISLEALLPGHTCCLECIKQHEEATQQLTATDQVLKSIAKAFPAALPHVELTASGLLAQSALKFLLEMGDFVPFFTFDLLKFETESYSFPPNPNCSSATCRQLQQEERERAALT